jgi:phage tail sheath gpL-like
MSYISLPSITLNMVARGAEVGLEDHRNLIVGQMLAAGTADAGLVLDVPRTNGEINALFGARSHLAMMLRAYRRINPYTNVDVIALEDAAGATKATAIALWGGTATASRTISVDVVSSMLHSYEIDIEIDDGPADINAKLKALVDADDNAPFTCALSLGSVADDTITFTAANGGKVANGWMIRVKGTLPAGVTATLTGWTGGATDPTLTTILDDVETIRYQGVGWPSEYSVAPIATWINSRKNLTNVIRDGVAIQYVNDTLSNAGTASLAINSSEFVMLWNHANNLAHYKGPHIPEAPDVVMAQVLASRALRFETDRNLNKVVSAIEPLDQFGGIHTCTLPYFNTLFPYLAPPLRGTGASEEDQAQAIESGLAVIGTNFFNNGQLLGETVTTYNNDGAGNEDDSWKYLNWRDTHSVLREYYVRNYKKRFAQYRLTRGDAVAGYAIANEPILRSYAMKLYRQLAEVAVTQLGEEGERLFAESLVITVIPEERKVTFDGNFPIHSQFAKMNGTVRVNFGVII